MRRGAAMILQRQDAEGIVQMQKGFATLQAIGASETRYSVLLAEAYLKIGQVENGLGMLAEVTGADCLKGELLLRQAVPDEQNAETCFHQALDVARQQQAKSLELRAATSLARLWQSQDKRQDAYDLLAPVYNWFTEGFDTADLIEAKTLLDELA